MSVRVDVMERLDEETVAAVLSLAEAAAETDGVRPLNEQATLHLRNGGAPGARAVLVHEGADLAGFAHLDPADPEHPDDGPSGELVVHPAFRGRGLGRRLLDAVLEESGGRVRLWAHGDHPAAARLAASAGLNRSRSLWQMRRPLDTPTPDPVMPSGVRLRTFETGKDEHAWVALNALAFATHPEQGAWTVDDIEQREREPWFDPAGFFLAVRPDGTPAGFHWTKVHRDGEDGEPVGEVYVVGVDPAEQGTGLGRALTLAGLAHLRSLGLPQVMLYVDEENRAAVRLYESLGFGRWKTDVMYSR
ncbi:mycothiol synthase [Planotetraspora kaengkrachanensis]|uniref:Mycothiol acetyltransferase n=1 Tax=Planotetraspora kaengkrachanensis TaxID=575193 RepID=A0A8J3PZ51_9ACTN|nr:mycothiol synthase [Planotetraspora kaengkrachanensis]GIG83723.1 mycothiol acetyltransferase [Planotetraspora kaengkrachanensis]